MKLNTAPANMALLSNVGAVGEFRIRNSAKAFRILSDGLYANKIRAIIRELGCNAVDSHVAAGRSDVPFDVHIPTPLEPWFAIRDYGIGLDHDQVTTIYTTYFESTKTDSNEFIGALGLGSKSPFSYTENFTITATKNGVQRIYTAFINDTGVPSVALMSESETTEHNGVEVKFSVEEQNTFRNWRDEAAEVFQWFRSRPNFSGALVNVPSRVYQERDIVPGVHQYSTQYGYGQRAVAVMGNIAYPVDVPNAQANLGVLAGLLSCPIEMHFEIGELDFQASREGLSYIPTTIAAIKAKLELLSKGLAVRIAEQADKITNGWQRAEFLVSKFNDALFRASVIEYVNQTKFDLVDITNSYIKTKNWRISVNDLHNRFNIKVSAFSMSGFNKTVMSRVRSYRDYNAKTGQYVESREFIINTHDVYVLNDTKTGAQARVRYHYTELPPKDKSKINHYIILEKSDPEKPALFQEFLAEINNPPLTQLVSTMAKKPAVKRELNKQGILTLEKRGGYRRNSTDVVWRQITDYDFDDTKTYYYLELDGNKVYSKISADYLQRWLATTSKFNSVIYGVRKNRLAEIRKMKNWRLLEDCVTEILANLSEDALNQIAMSGADYCSLQNFTGVAARLDTDSALAQVCRSLRTIVSDPTMYKHMMNTYCPNVDLAARKEKLVQLIGEVHRQYPLLKHIDYRADQGAVYDYIKMVDSAKNKQ